MMVKGDPGRVGCAAVLKNDEFRLGQRKEDLNGRSLERLVCEHT